MQLFKAKRESMVQLLDSSGNPLKASDTAHRAASHQLLGVFHLVAATWVCR